MWLPCRTSSLGGELHVARGLKEHWGIAQRSAEGETQFLFAQGMKEDKMH